MTSARRTLGLAVLAIVAFASQARAADFNVSDAAGFSAALTTAQGNGTADRVLLAAGSYAGPFNYNGNEDLKVLGAGAGQTVITSGSSANGLFLQGSSANYHIADLGFSLTGNNAVGLRINGGGIVERITATVAPGVNNATPVFIGAANPVTVQHATVNTNLNSRGILVQTAGTATILDSSVTGGTSGIEADQTGGHAIVRRVTVRDSQAPISATFGASIIVSDSLLLLGSTFANALNVGDSGNSSNFTGSIDADRMTIIGDGTTSQRAAAVSPNSAGDNYSVSLDDSVIVSVSGALYCFATAGTGAVTTDYSRVPAGSSDGCNNGIVQNHPISTGAALNFLDAAGGDYRIAWNSGLVDAGNPAALTATTDLGSLPRPVDGDGNGTAIRDVGAFEYQRSAPVVSGSALPTTVGPGELVAFSGSSTDADPGETATYAWAFDDGASGTGADVSHAFATAGTHTATVTATDPAGATGTAQVQVTVTAPPAPADPGGPGNGNPGGGDPGDGGLGGGSADKVAPSLTKVSLRKGVARFTLSEAARVKVRIERLLHGSYRRIKGSVSYTCPAGASRRKLPARMRKLKRGRYRAILTARDAAGNTGRAVTAGFVVRRT